MAKEENASEYVKKSPEPLSHEKLEKADLIIAMRNEHKKFIKENFPSDKKVVVWGIRDPIRPEVTQRQVKERLKPKIKRLLNRISS